MSSFASDEEDPKRKTRTRTTRPSRYAADDYELTTPKASRTRKKQKSEVPTFGMSGTNVIQTKVDDSEDPDADPDEDPDDETGSDEEKVPMAPPAPLRNPPTRPTGSPFNPSGLAAAVERTFPNGIPPEEITTMLRWQADVNGDPTTIPLFRAEIMAQLELVVFAFIQPEDTNISLVHSAATFAARGAEGYLKGKDIGFVGDLTDFAHPLPTLLKKERPWKWNAVEITGSEEVLETFYTNPLNTHRWFVPPTGSVLEKVKVPRLLLLPPNLIEFCCKRPRTPYDLLRHVLALALSTGNAPSANQYKLVLQWCVAACHGTVPGGSSIMAYSIDAAHSQSQVFHQWIRLRLDSTVGYTRAAPHTPTTLPTQQNDLSHLAVMAAEFGKGVLTALQPSLGVPLAPAVGGTGPTDGKTYDAYNFAVLQGFSQCPTTAGLQPIWGLFTQTKCIETHHLHIKDCMKTWARNNSVTINKGIFFTKQTIEDIMHLRFNPSGGVAYFSTAEKGISILVCHPKAGDDRDHARAEELAQDLSLSNRTLAEALSLGKHDPRPPPECYNDLKAAIGTFCALLWTLFGEYGQYFTKCFELYTCLDSDNTAENAHLFKPLLCRQLLWAILDDGREYFSQALLPNSFIIAPGAVVKYPVSSLEELIQPIKNQSPVVKGNFPKQWLGRGDGRSDWQDSRSVRSTHSTGGQQPQPHVPHMVPSGSSVGSGTQNTQRSNASSLTASTTRPPPTCRQTDIHPRIRTTMGAYIARIKSLQITRIMTIAGVRWTDMPTLSNFMVNGTNSLCYNYVLGKCNPRYCTHRQGHASANDVTDEFADAICTLLQPGLTGMTADLARASWSDFKATIETTEAARAAATE